MSSQLLNKIFKRKGKATEAKPVRKTVWSEDVTVKSQAATDISKAVKGRELVYGVLRAQHLTEKTNKLAEAGSYVFIVSPAANAVRIKQAVEVKYDVNVLDVRILCMPSKKIKRGRQVGYRPGFKKAIVKIKKGQTIEAQ